MTTRGALTVLLRVTGHPHPPIHAGRSRDFLHPLSPNRSGAHTQVRPCDPTAHSSVKAALTGALPTLVAELFPQPPCRTLNRTRPRSQGTYPLHLEGSMKHQGIQLLLPQCFQSGHYNNNLNNKKLNKLLLLPRRRRRYNNQ